MSAARKRKPIAERLRAWRAASGITREAAADILGVPLRTLERWEQGKFTDHIERAIRIADTLARDGF